MSRLVLRSGLAAGLAGLVLAAAPARADAPPAAGLACAGGSSMSERAACRPVRAAHRRPRPERALVADARLRPVDPAHYGPGRYVSLIILGVGY